MLLGIPPAETRIDLDLVRALLGEQHPDLVGEELAIADEGFDNVLVRIGESLCARLPRRALGAELVAVEQRWLPVLADTLPLPVPVLVRKGRPGHGYPWDWGIVRWLEGTSVLEHGLRADQAQTLAGFLSALHRPPHPEAPYNAYRGVPLAERVDAIEPRMDGLRARRGVYPEPLERAVREAWARALAAPAAFEPTWLHGDLHPSNVLSDHGRLAGILDWGDVCAGDRATDIASLWMLLPTADARQSALDTLARDTALSAATIERARGWAISFGLILLAAGDDEDPFALAGRETLERVVQGPP